MGQVSVPSLTVEAHGQPYWSIQPLLPWPAMILLLLVMLVLVWWSYRGRVPEVSLQRKRVLMGLRVAAALVLWLVLLGPSRIQESRWRQKGLCALVLDASSSMNINDGPRGLSRWAVGKRLFAEHREDLRKLDEAYEVRRFLFGSEVTEVPRLPGEEGSSESTKADEHATDLAALLERLLSESQGAPCAGVLLISDGRHNAPSDPLPPARRLQEASVPLVAIGTGSESAPKGYREVSIRWLEVPERTFVNAEMVIRVDIDSHLSQATQVPLTFTVDREVIFNAPVALPAGPSTRRMTLRYVPTELGFHRVQVVAVPLPGEASEENNRQTASFRVFRSRLAIWYVEGTLRKEFGSLCAALGGAPNVTLRALNAFDQAAGGPPDTALLPESDAEWNETRLVILGDVSARRFSTEQLQRLARRVESGGALLMLGGGSTLGLGEWAASPIATVLPVELSGAPKLVAGPFEMQAATDRHPAMLFDPDPGASLGVLHRCPKVPWLNMVASVKPVANVLLRAAHHPLLVVQEFGKGRSGVFASAETWQWGVKTGQAAAHQLFWRNLVTWLTRSDYREPEKVVFAESDRLRAKEGEEFRFTVQVQPTEKTENHMSTARVRAMLELNGDVKKVWDLGRGAGNYNVQAVPHVAGSYTFRAIVLGPSDEPLGIDHVEFQVDALDMEYRTPRANLRLLQHLAQASDGFYFDAEHAGRAFTQLLQRPVGFSKLIRNKEDGWNRWVFFAAFVALLCGEWVLRKWSRLP